MLAKFTYPKINSNDIMLTKFTYQKIDK